MRFLLTHKLAVLVGLCAAPLAAQTAASESAFPHLWSDFLAACGGIMSDPHEAIATPRRIPGYAQHGAAANDDGTDMSGVFHDPSSDREISYHLIRSRAGFSLFCDASQSFEEPIDATLAAPGIRAMIEASGEMTVAGGLQSSLPGATMPILEPEGSSYAYVVDGVFPQWNIPVHVNVSSYGLHATVFTQLESGN